MSESPGQRIGRLLDQLAAGCFWFLIYVAALSVLAALTKITPLEFAGSDPLIRVLGYPLVTVVTIVVGVAGCAYWIRRRRLKRDQLRAALIWSLGGAGMAAAACGLLYTIFGAQLPTFIPPEESAAAGLVLGLTAGLLEEVVFRIGLLPALMIFFSRKLSFNASAVLSSLAVGLLFAISHELAGDPFQLRYFVTRVIVPGAIMSMAFLKLHPGAVLSGHAAAHFLIPVLFVSAG